MTTWLRLSYKIEITLFRESALYPYHVRSTHDAALYKSRCSTGGNKWFTTEAHAQTFAAIAVSGVCGPEFLLRLNQMWKRLYRHLQYTSNMAPLLLGQIEQLWQDLD